MEYIIPSNVTPQRADKLLAELLAGSFSRNHISRLIREGKVLVAGRKIKASTLLKPSYQVIIKDSDMPPATNDNESLLLPWSILYEDDHIIVVDKPPGLTVHHGSGRVSKTLVDILIKERPVISGVGEAGRWGIVHRLDKDTSGVMVVAKNNETLTKLFQQFKQHSVTKIYLAIVRGTPTREEDVIMLAIGRHTTDRKRMSVATSKSRYAITKWRILERLGPVSLLEIRPKTGRTHQIRVHLAAAGMPILGDPVYGRLRPNARKVPRLVKDCAKILKRQALHASVLGILHPLTGEYLEWTSPLPPDMKTVMALARSSTSQK